jgi:hypothetical protein
MKPAAHAPQEVDALQDLQPGAQTIGTEVLVLLVVPLTVTFVVLLVVFPLVAGGVTVLDAST